MNAPLDMRALADMAPELAHSRLIAYAATQWPQYEDAWHHRQIARRLEALERGEITRLMIFVPPRHGKSMLASEYFPAWYLGRNPDHYVIAATYAQELADDFGRKVRDQIEDPLFGAIFPHVRMQGSSRSAKRFHVGGPHDPGSGNSGAYFAVGVGGPLTGRGAHLLLIDDPVKNREEADSELIRDRLWSWYTSTAYTRLMPGGRICVIQTRWHEDDLSGRILREHGHENWEVLELPAIDEHLKALWPAKYPIERLREIEKSIGPREWSALYQQRPAPEEGAYFRESWLRRVDLMPDVETMNVYGASDYAVTADGGDYTVHVVVGVDADGRMYLLDLWRARTASDQWVDSFVGLVKRWKPISWAEEAGQIKAGIGPWLTNRMRERGAYVHRETFPTRGDKAVRAQSFRGRMAVNGLYIHKDAPFYGELFSELMSFPVGVHDDQVDALGLVGQLLDQMYTPIKQEKPVDRYSHEVDTSSNDWMAL